MFDWLEKIFPTPKPLRPTLVAKLPGEAPGFHREILETTRNAKEALDGAAINTVDKLWPEVREGIRAAAKHGLRQYRWPLPKRVTDTAQVAIYSAIYSAMERKLKGLGFSIAEVPATFQLSHGCNHIGWGLDISW